jgi:hypothetical protein
LSPALHSSVEQIVESAIARRPDVLGAYAIERASQAKVKAAEAEFLPKVFMSAFTSYASGGSSITAIPSVAQQAPTVNLNGYRYGASVFLGITVPIYDGGLRSAVLTQARNDADSASTKLTRAKEESVRQVVVSQSALETSLAAYEAANPTPPRSRTTPRSRPTARASARSRMPIWPRTSYCWRGMHRPTRTVARYRRQPRWPWPRSGRRDTRAGRLGTALSAGYAPAEAAPARP